jgi:NTP pyrophosphatase (non-canonical NTP hydrolase)
MAKSAADVHVRPIADLGQRHRRRPYIQVLGAIHMNFSDLEKSALHLNELYEQLEIKRWGRIWTTGELALGFVGDVGDLAKLIQANAGIRDIDDCKAKLGHELSDCLWSIIVLANKCGIDLEAEFVKNTRELAQYVSSELGT